MNEYLKKKSKKKEDPKHIDKSESNIRKNWPFLPCF